MEEVVRLDGRCEDCSKMVWKCNNCPIEKDCQDCSIQTYGRSLRLAREWLENDDMKRLIAKSGDALVKMFNACSKSKKEHEMKGKVIAEWQPVKGERVLAKIGMSEEYQEVIFDEKVESTIETIYCHGKNKTDLSAVSCIRQIKPKYKAYTEPKLEWIGKGVRNKKNLGKDEIIGIQKSDGIWYLRFDTYPIGSLESCFNKIEWYNSTTKELTPFGEKI
jgi:hypothetical protein